MLPKAKAGTGFDRLPSLPVFALIETAAGLASARTLAAHPAVIGLTFGTLDFCADIEADLIAAILDPARLQLVLAARLAGIARPLDGVTTDVRSLGSAHMDAQHAGPMGMGGKLAIHPTQIGEIQDAFRPTPELVGWAGRIMAADPGVSMVDSQMVELPVKARASRILHAAE
jgi:citrate lyase subunit beta / citryl-CoA lyase